MAELKNVKQLEVLPYHDMGKTKYEKLGIDYPLADTEPMTNDDAAKAKDIILNAMKEKKRKELHEKGIL